MRRDVYQAIADPTRRQILTMLAGNSLNLNTVANKFDISRPAVSKHMKILIQCGLVVVKQRGRERYCEAHLQKLREVNEWMEHLRIFWNTKIDVLENYLLKEQTPLKTNKNKA